MKFERITVDPQVCTGKPCIRGLRVSYITKSTLFGFTYSTI